VKTVLLDNTIHPDALAILQREVTVLPMYDAPLPELMQALSSANAAILSTRFRISQHEIDIAACLEVIGRPGAGVDSVDVEAASQAGIPVVYTPEAPTESVAEHVLCLMLMLAKKMYVAVAALRDGDFGIRSRIVGTESTGKALGIVGLGHIGSRVAQMCRQGLDMRVLAYDPYVSEEQAASMKVTLVHDLLELMSKADFVSIHTPLIPNTRSLIGEAEIAVMKPSAYLINTSRGAVVDEKALIRALQEGRIAGAGLDVFDPEPPKPDNPLLSMDNVVATPHLSSFTDEGRARMGIGVAQQVLQVLRGERPRFLADPAVWERRRTMSIQE